VFNVFNVFNEVEDKCLSQLDAVEGIDVEHDRSTHQDDAIHLCFGVCGREGKLAFFNLLLMIVILIIWIRIRLIRIRIQFFFNADPDPHKTNTDSVRNQS